ncbi:MULTISPECIES: SDR family NAD(P)-dependent oxidoreductase [Actinomadura]|uniref:SDR family NAD(P)-dependent oxidoreductase n=1 Tax=Actinomadura TaxID=1988 RepID=UPI0003ACF1C3|nr:glucose 1-dehydrogenase [Actinomadura madurae]
MDSTPHLDGKVAIVTGATGGIGAVIARTLAAAGAAVTVVGRRAEAGEAVAKDLPRAMFVPADLTDSSTHRRIVDATMDRFGRLDILVNNAAVYTSGPAIEGTEEDFDRIVALNYKAAFFLTQAALPGLIASGAGRIVNLSTVGTVKTYWGASIYNSSKAALDNLTRTWALEHGPDGVRVNAVNPGIVVDGPMSAPAQAALDIERDVLPTIPAGRLATAADVAAVVTFLAGPSADYLNGVVIPLDGGMTA